MTTMTHDDDREGLSYCAATRLARSLARSGNHGSHWRRGSPLGQDPGRPAREEEGGDGDVALSEEVEEGRPQLRPTSKEPSKYAVVLHNDDYTTMDFVVEVLQRFFKKTGDEAVRIMLKVHQDGRGVAGVYSYEIAETKSVQVNDHAQARGFPLKSTVEEAT